MDRAQKVEAVAELHKTFQEVGSVIVTQYSGLTVSQITELRGKMSENGANLKVAKNRLAQRALKGTQYEGISELFTGPVAIATSTDPVAAAKVVCEFSKGNDSLVVIGGALGEKVLDASGVIALSKLPSLDEIRATLVAMVQTPGTRIATIAQAPASQLARVTNAYAEKGGAA